MKNKYSEIFLQTIPLLIGILLSYLFWKNNILLAIIYLAMVLIILKIKYYKGDLFALIYGFIIGFLIEVIGTKVSGYQTFSNPDFLGIPFWLLLAWAYGFMLMKRIGVLIKNFK